MMATIKVSSFIDASVERVFDLFTDIQHASKNVMAIKKVDILSSGPFHLGFQWCETRDVLGVLDDAVMEITSFRANHSYTVTHHKAGVRIDAHFTFAPSITGTNVAIEFELHKDGVPPGLFSPLEWAIGNQVRHVLGDDLQDLTEAIEHVRVVGRSDSTRALQGQKATAVQ